jgi:hypothetical protein
MPTEALLRGDGLLKELMDDVGERTPGVRT